ncbi:MULTISPECIES: ATP-dependent Clp protease proteolytic subunit [unclassified Mycolicibacterium]|uniref:ATP-dependent Clp protease proteolytic subunit n=1 Tax=unclassified Mycolicibacterium TaxID=2636767 RepID=UPI0012DD8863|nr:MULTISPECIES: ATP-dependent Clp protease proteolytic subunit [unclassified Mycolicibacterium]MUL85449.1 ATP-dependent Clp protease proteolytic subunit [Mycolicibacterium sp. CBMA 329]MUL88787.1 ATP-dependent Clp protease proteolytic subunit [Mycolicibacterium sp. CBMA 331]MUM03073.1 ATP-dependent Clp protease proteolytic subunit [Mycolicibacterium sp. CBMA 334]MUM24877.1 ATP-dependent Clp protease proteolytic subunit [Mycolicibacterium sp. CBMA 295]MUM40434.1 ATP-dependent Clp protease prot
MSSHVNGSIPPWPPEYPWPPAHPEPPQPRPEPQPPAPSRLWGDQDGWSARLSERLLEQRIVVANGWLDEEAATRLCAQLLTLDAEASQPIRLEVQSLGAELSAVLTVMGVLDVLRAPVSAYAGGRISGPAIGVLATADHRYAYPSALFVLCEPRLRVEGTMNSLALQEEQIKRMRADLLSRLAEVTGRPVDEVQSDVEHQRLLDVDQALDYGLIDGPAQPRRPARTGLQPPADT